MQNVKCYNIIIILSDDKCENVITMTRKISALLSFSASK